METKEVKVSLSEIIDLNLEGFLDLLEELFFADVDEEKRYEYYLSDISYIPLRVEDQMIVLSISGEVIEN